MGRLGCLTLAAVLGVALIVWSGARQALVPFGDLLQVETELAEQAGCAYSDPLPHPPRQPLRADPQRPRQPLHRPEPRL